MNLYRVRKQKPKNVRVTQKKYISGSSIHSYHKISSSIFESQKNLLLFQNKTISVFRGQHSRVQKDENAQKQYQNTKSQNNFSQNSAQPIQMDSLRLLKSYLQSLHLNEQEKKLQIYEEEINILSKHSFRHAKSVDPPLQKFYSNFLPRKTKLKVNIQKYQRVLKNNITVRLDKVYAPSNIFPGRKISPKKNICLDYGQETIHTDSCLYEVQSPLKKQIDKKIKDSRRKQKIQRLHKPVMQLQVGKETGLLVRKILSQQNRKHNN